MKEEGAVERPSVREALSSADHVLSHLECFMIGEGNLLLIKQARNAARIALSSPGADDTAKREAVIQAAREWAMARQAVVADSGAGWIMPRQAVVADSGAGWIMPDKVDALSKAECALRDATKSLDRTPEDSGT